MPLKNGHTTRQERKFAENYAMTGDVGYSAAKAGYKQYQGGSQALQRPAVQDEIRRIQMAKLFNEVLPLAVQEHIKLLEDPKTPAGAKVQAVKLAYDRTLGSQEGAHSKAPHEMSTEELQAELAASKLRLAALESAKADQARPIIEAKASDVFE